MKRQLRKSKMSKSKEGSYSADKDDYNVTRNVELYRVLINAGLDLQTLKSMMDHRKKTSLQMKENSRKLVNRSRLIFTAPGQYAQMEQ